MLAELKEDKEPDNETFAMPSWPVLEELERVEDRDTLKDREALPMLPEESLAKTAKE